MRKKIHDVFLTLAILLLISILSLFELKKVKGDSMSETLKEGEYILVFRAMYGLRSPFFKGYIINWSNVQKGDIVMFKIRGRYIIKRCYATENDSIYFYQKKVDSLPQYFMRVGQKDIKLKKDEYYRLFMDCTIFQTEGVQRVPKGTLLLLGDNALFSFDSKEYGYVTQNSILGKVMQWK